MTQGFPIPTNFDSFIWQSSNGFATPQANTTPQVATLLPKRVIPIVFIPGIMGSNLRMKPARQHELKADNNIAWRPDNKGNSAKYLYRTPAERQLYLDPSQTEVDSYDPVSNPTGDKNETSDDRNSAVKARKLKYGYAAPPNTRSPLLLDDPHGTNPAKTKDQKARERGWGEVFFGSYSQLLQLCEERMSNAFFNGILNPEWRSVVGVNPQEWQSATPSLSALTEEELKQAVSGCWFPVHAMGYNWLESNGVSGRAIAKKIKNLISSYNAKKFDCRKVIIVTHSMGGLVARAVIHPAIGGALDQVLGIVHGVMPAIGAGTAYKRMRCGFEDPSMFDPVPKIIGNHGDEITAVLANARGGLELLPSLAYGNDWLKIEADNKIIMSLPRHGDPYEEIYKLRGKWYGMLREEWINPAGAREANFDRTCSYLDKAKKFHEEIRDTYHPNSYAHYGADANRQAFQRVTWRVKTLKNVRDIEAAKITKDNMKGEFKIENLGAPQGAAASGSDVSLVPPAEPGDQTVPAFSADHQLRSGKFKGIFRQTGYEHQGSYQNGNALNSTLYCLVRIAQSMSWS